MSNQTRLVITLNIDTHKPKPEAQIPFPSFSYLSESS